MTDFLGLIVVIGILVIAMVCMADWMLGIIGRLENEARDLMEKNISLEMQIMRYERGEGDEDD